MKYCIESIKDSRLDFYSFITLEAIINKDTLIFDRFKDNFTKPIEKLFNLGYLSIKSKSIKVLNSDINKNFKLENINSDFLSKLNVQTLINRTVTRMKLQGVDEEEIVIKDSYKYETKINFLGIFRLYELIKMLNNEGVIGSTYKYLSDKTSLTNIQIKTYINILEDFGILNNDEIGLKYDIGNKLIKINVEHKYECSNIDIKIDQYDLDKIIHKLDKSNIPKNKSGFYILINDNKEIIYVGKSVDLKSRIYTHVCGLTHTKQFSKEIEYIALLYVDKSIYDDCSDILEKDIIKTLCPKYNVIHNAS